MSLFIGLNLFTVKDEANKNFSRTVQKISEFGYQGVEISAIDNVSPGEIRKCIDDCGLIPIAKHASYQQLYEALDKEINDSVEMGCKYLICSWNTYNTKDDYLKAAEFFNGVGEKALKYGISFAYHGHNHEFQVFDGEYGQDILFANTDPRYMKNQIDIYWVKYAGLDPAAYIKKYKGRCPFVHFKDMKDEVSKDFAEVGEGIIDIKACLKQSMEDGCLYYIVEQDKCGRPCLESVKISIDNIKRIERDGLNTW